MSRVTAGWTTVLLTTLALPCAGQQTIRGKGAPRMLIEGFVLDAETGVPVDGATVTLIRSGRSARTLTDSLGHYRALARLGGALALTVERIGYATLRVDSVLIRAPMHLDFALRPEPVPLSPLTVFGDATSASTESVLPDDPQARAVTRRVASLALEESRASPLVPGLMVGLGGGKGDGGGDPAPPGGGEAGALGVRGSVTRQGATFVDGAPAQLGEPASFLAYPFGERGNVVRGWDAGAPARITGGLEYVTEVDERPPRGPQGLAVGGSLDLVRASMRASALGERWGSTARGRTTLPWTPQVLGEGGHRTRELAFHVWSAPLPRQRLVAGVSARRETLPSGSAPGAATALSTEFLRSLRWEARLGEGLLVTHLGAGRSVVKLPRLTSFGNVPGISLTSVRSSLGVSYSDLVSPSVEAVVGMDRLGYRWTGTVTSSGAVWGGFTELVWRRRDARLGARVGTRVERATTQRGARFAPRIQIDWRLGPDLVGRIGSGVYHELLLTSSPTSPAGRPQAPVLARGLHHRATATLTLGPGAVRADAWVKRLHDVPGAQGILEVKGGALGFGMAAGAERFGIALKLEHRVEGPRTVWSRFMTADVQHTLPGHVDLRVRAEASRNPGGLVLTGVIDTTGVLDGGPTTLGGTGSQPWSVRIDGELSRTFSPTSELPALKVYARILNVTGRELRPLFIEAGSLLDPWLPRVLVIGASVALGSDRSVEDP